MPAPRMNPTGMIEVTSTSRLDGKLELFGYGQDSSIPNPGDLLIVSTDYLNENFHNQKIEFRLRIRGRDMALFSAAAQEALLLYEDNKEWLMRPMSTPKVEQVSRSSIRSNDQINAIKSYYTKLG